MKCVRVEISADAITDSMSFQFMLFICNYVKLYFCCILPSTASPTLYLLSSLRVFLVRRKCWLKKDFFAVVSEELFFSVGLMV